MGVDSSLWGGGIHIIRTTVGKSWTHQTMISASCGTTSGREPSRGRAILGTCAVPIVTGSARVSSS